MWIVRVKFLPNKLVKILNWTFFIAVFYFLFLSVMLKVGYQSPVFFSLFLLIPCGIILKRYLLGYNIKNIDRHRCNSCGSFKCSVVTHTEFISKKHDTEHHSWREHVGTSRSTVSNGNSTVNVTTNYYQQKGAVYNITYMYYSDTIKCQKCGVEWKKSRVEKKYGHV